MSGSLQELTLPSTYLPVNLGENNTASMVVDFDRPKLGNRKLYSINDDSYFVTSEHPFRTADGWKSIDPNATLAEGVYVEVKKLEVDDILTLFDKYGKMKVLSIKATNSDLETQLYNFKLNGSHTYYANGFLVHNKI